MIIAFFIGWIFLRNYIFQVLTDATTFFPIGCGAVTCLFLSWLLERKTNVKPISWKSTIAAAMGIFLAGTIAGCTLNFIVNGQIAAAPFGLWSEFIDWFYKPFYWFVIFGAPLSLLIGALYFLAVRCFFDR